jgi:peptidoglycan/LPS O-acetylase OafA/YrhL
MACYLFRNRIARWPAVPGALAGSLAAFILLGSLLPTMTALFAIYAIAMLAIHVDCAGCETLLSRLRFDRWSSLTYSCYMLHIPVATVIITFGTRLLSLSPHERLILAPVAIIVLAFASVVSLRTFETPLRRYLTEAYDRRASRAEPSPAISRQESTS